MKANLVNISSLKAKLSSYLRLVVKGHIITIVDRRHPVAKLVPADLNVALATIKPIRPTSFRDYPFPEPVAQVDKIDSLSVLLEDRAKR